MSFSITVFFVLHPQAALASDCHDRPRRAFLASPSPSMLHAPCSLCPPARHGLPRREEELNEDEVARSNFGDVWTQNLERTFSYFVPRVSNHSVDEGRSLTLYLSCPNQTLPKCFTLQFSSYQQHPLCSPLAIKLLANRFFVASESESR